MRYICASKIYYEFQKNTCFLSYPYRHRHDRAGIFPGFSSDMVDRVDTIPDSDIDGSCVLPDRADDAHTGLYGIGRYVGCTETDEYG